MTQKILILALLFCPSLHAMEKKRPDSPSSSSIGSSTIYSISTSADSQLVPSPTGSPRTTPDYHSAHSSPRAISPTTLTSSRPSQLNLSTLDFRLLQISDHTFQLRMPTYPATYVDLAMPQALLLARMLLTNPQVYEHLQPSADDAESPTDEHVEHPERALSHHDSYVLRSLADADAQDFDAQLPLWARELRERNEHTIHMTAAVDLRPLTLAKATVAGLGTTAVYGAFQHFRPHHPNGRFIPLLAAASSSGSFLKLTALGSVCAFGLWQLRKIFGYMHSMAERNNAKDQEIMQLQEARLRESIENYDARIKLRFDALEKDVTYAHESVEQLQRNLATMQETVVSVGERNENLIETVNAAVTNIGKLHTLLEKKAAAHREHSRERSADDLSTAPHKRRHSHNSDGAGGADDEPAGAGSGVKRKGSKPELGSKE